MWPVPTASVAGMCAFQDKAVADSFWPSAREAGAAAAVRRGAPRSPPGPQLELPAPALASSPAARTRGLPPRDRGARARRRGGMRYEYERPQRRQKTVEGQSAAEEAPTAISASRSAPELRAATSPNRRAGDAAPPLGCPAPARPVPGLDIFIAHGAASVMRCEYLRSRARIRPLAGATGGLRRRDRQSS